jgi:predicted DNA-binding transcriptional regulator AlpA
MKGIYRTDETDATVDRLALRPKEAATALGISDKTLWSLTSPRGSVPCVRVGSRVLYFRHQLERWADEQAAQQDNGEESIS